MKKVKILNWKSPYNKDAFIDVANLWVSPDGAFAIIERYRSELFVWVRILERGEEGYLCSFLEAYEPYYSTIDARWFDVDWSCLEYGFCKLLRTEMESGFSGTDRRFYLPKY